MRNQISSEYKRKYFNGTAISVFACDQETGYFKLDEMSTKIDAKGAQIYNSRIIKYLTELETTKKCAGVCKKSTFYPFTDIRNGPPQESCRKYIIEDFTDNKGTYRFYAIIFIASSMCIFVAWFFSFGISFRLKWDHRGSPLTFGYVIRKVTDETSETAI